MNAPAWQSGFNRDLVKAGSQGSFGWWRMSFSQKDDERYFQRVWTCGAESLGDAINHPAPAGKYLAVEAHIAWNWTAATASTHWFGWLVEDGVLVKRPAEVSTTAALNLEFLGDRNRENTLHQFLFRFKRLAAGFAQRVLCWRVDVQDSGRLWDYNHKAFGLSPVVRRRRVARDSSRLRDLTHLGS